MTRRSGILPSAPDQAAADRAPGPTGWNCALVLLAVALAYLPVLSAGFIWDDDGHVTRPELQSLGGLTRIWTEIGATQQYYPLLHSAFWLEHLAWGDAPLGYHLVNVLLHALAACLFGVLLRQLAVPGAWFAALLFALHPVAVESVAWVSEQKNTLSAVCYLAAALAYLRFDEQRRWSGYALATGLFMLALLTKTVTATLPAALWVVIWWRRGLLDPRRDVLPLLPWLALGAAGGLVTAHFERVLIGAQGADFNLSVIQRVLLAGRVFWFYLGKLAWPDDLMFIYPRWTVDASGAAWWICLAGAVALVGALFAWRRRSRAPLAAALLFGGTLFPVLGFFNVFPFLFSYVADHFQYLASLAVFALVAAGLTQAAARVPRWLRTVGAAGVLAVLGILTYAQAGTYHDATTLYQTTLARNPGCWLAHHNLAITLASAGRVEEAIPHLETVLKLHPDYAPAENNLGDDLSRLGRHQEAIPHLERALRLQPNYDVAHNNLGSTLVALGQPAQGIPQFERALQIRPNFPEAERNLGMALALLNRTAEALPHFERAVQLRPSYAEAELNRAIAVMLLQGLAAAVPHFERALALDPDSTEAHDTYARALMQAGRFEAALRECQEVVRLAPRQASAQMNLALVHRQLGHREEAMQHYLEAVRLDPRLAR